VTKQGGDEQLTPAELERRLDGAGVGQDRWGRTTFRNPMARPARIGVGVGLVIAVLGLVVDEQIAVATAGLGWTFTTLFGAVAALTWVGSRLTQDGTRDRLHRAAGLLLGCAIAFLIIGVLPVLALDVAAFFTS